MREVILLNKNILAIGIVFLFIMSAITPITFGYNVKISDSIEQPSIIINYGNPPEEEWNRTLGASGQCEYGFSVVQTFDGGYAVAGHINQDWRGSDDDVWLVKTDEIGNEEWNVKYGGLYHDVGFSVWQTTDGGYVVTGQTVSFGAGDYDVFLFKTDEFGNEEFNTTFGGLYWDVGRCVQQTIDGGYILVGMTESYGIGGSDIWLIKTNSNGNEEWNKTFGRGDYDDGFFVQQTNDGGFIITGDIYPGLCLIKTDSNGNKLWEKTFGDYEEIGNYVQQTSDGGYVIVGQTRIAGKGEEVWLIKTDDYGNLIWDNTFGDLSIDRGYSGQETVDGGFIITGVQRPKGTYDNNILLIKTDTEGDEEWNLIYNRSDYDNGLSVQQTDDNGYIIAGTTKSSNEGPDFDIWLIKMSPDYINIPPDDPILVGQSYGNTGENYTFCVVNARDPEGKELRIFWDWGDGTNSGWLGLYNSGETICNEHSWEKKGTYMVKVYLKDDYGAIVNSSLEITMPRNKMVTNSLLLRFLEQFPILQMLLLLRLGLQ